MAKPREPHISANCGVIGEAAPDLPFFHRMSHSLTERRGRVRRTNEGEVECSAIPRIDASYRKDVLRDAELRMITDAAIADIEGSTTCTRADLVSFTVLFLLRTGMNVSSALALGRDCSTRDDEGGHWVLWGKRRAGRVLRDRYRPSLWGPIEILDELRRRHARELPFSFDGMTGLLNLTGVLAPWCERHGIRYFTLQELRPARASQIYKESGDLFGQVYDAFSARCFAALLEEDLAEFSNLFPKFFDAAFMAHGRVLKQERGRERGLFKLAMGPIGDLMGLSGYAILTKEVTGKDFQSVVVARWDIYMNQKAKEMPSKIHLYMDVRRRHCSRNPAGSQR